MKHATTCFKNQVVLPAAIVLGAAVYTKYIHYKTLFKMPVHIEHLPFFSPYIQRNYTVPDFYPPFFSKLP
jgi:predicted AlkP superfamily pyrophosphatase or phosphodiesterase